ncbi:UDP-N-acetylmuramate--L-alanine ligase [Microbacterium faecale]|uniref:UDP-N-acetylmuramate--L-alanine ligase n=1 Tax=Microbacterium faecale TaxID=1804630 RepID=A0A916YGE2_9MICO|nr:UDP-N-acetylmuramate--L-alanine ligase [Microbacterium faecale]GGD42241.1 UDP-N-acetylmuramate--L-alanine ligase [Microbacterium faecale]
MITPDLTVPIPETIGSVHFVGIGGSGISGIARMFLGAGIPVSGSDRAESPATRELAALGATVSIGHDAANLGEVDALVYTGAIWPENPEYLAAAERGIPRLHRSQALKYLISGRRLVSVAGAHGKTTTTGMIVTGLDVLDVDPSFVSGGVIQQYGVSSRAGTDSLFVVEADESDGSFLIYDTSVALITNVDADHLDHYGSHEAFDDAFVAFADAAREAVVISADDPGARRVHARLRHERVITFGEAPDADVRVQRAPDGSVVLTAGGESARLEMRVPGRHNLLNAAAAVAVLVALGQDVVAAASAVATFGGTVRRFELHGTRRGVSVYDDYAHHPTEVAAALEAARSVVGNGRLIALHQPHTYSRTQLMAAEFARVLETYADHSVVLDVYGAREDPIPGVTGELVERAFADPNNVSYVPDWQTAAERAAHVARDGDFIITLGCGNVNLIVPQVMGALEQGE